ncbi:hypothetical protein LCX57_004818 [Vibrio parahaemolyticus]|nr:hypothetical protein [Vibrio parahaemolyticus]EJC6989796.1 hypothetical protein [Vibrio parahaemolyticus]EJG1904066.1 hypothetical protein [Vibrio parahaemolyticus]
MQISECEQKVDNINTLISHLLNDKNALFFDKIHVIRPDFKNQELSFIRLVSWLYTLYFESGKCSLKVIKSSMATENQELYSKHSKIIGQLRTKLHHNVDRKSSRSFKIERDCHVWMKSACSKNIPTDEEDWKNCSIKLLNEAEKLLSMIAHEIEEMTDSPVQKEIFTLNWNTSKEKSLKPHIYDEIIGSSLSLLNHTSIDIVAYRQKYYDSWNLSISQLNSDVDYLNEARKIVESCIIKDFALKLPITMSTLNDHFLLSTNFLLDLLAQIHKLDLKDCSQEEVLEKIKSELPIHLLK